MKAITTLLMVCSIMMCYLVVPEYVSAAEVHKDSFTQCMENVDLSAMKNAQFADCYSAELKHQDALLNQSFKVLRERVLDQLRANQMVKAQQAWIVFRDKWCTFAESSDQAPSHEINKLDCLVNLTKAQIKILSDAEK